MSIDVAKMSSKAQYMAVLGGIHEVLLRHKSLLFGSTSRASVPSRAPKPQEVACSGHPLEESLDW